MKNPGGSIMPRHTVLETVVAVLAVLGGMGILLLIVSRIMYLALGSAQGSALGTAGGGFAFSLTRSELLVILVGAVAVVVGLAVFLWKR
jgi:hypothetical protein